MFVVRKELNTFVQNKKVKAMGFYQIVFVAVVAYVAICYAIAKQTKRGKYEFWAIFPVSLLFTPIIGISGILSED